MNNNFYKIAINALFMLCLVAANSAAMAKDYQRAKWDPIHFKPLIDTATDQQCLECHQEILDRRILKKSPAGLESSKALAWYQTLATYKGEQDTFHRRHLVSDYAKEVMTLKCNTCHQGNDPKDETANSSATTPTDLTQRKMVDPKICLMCHGKFPNEAMKIADWPEARKQFNNNCLMCHANILKNRHNVDFLNAEAIEEAGKKEGDVCYGCHGGRSWYSISYPYIDMDEDKWVQKHLRP